MAQFRYNATNEHGQPQAGEITAGDLEGARRTLTAEGLTVTELTAVDTVPSTAAGHLTDADAEEVLAQVAEIGKAGIPMAVGLRAAAAESTNRRIKHALEHLAEGTEQGQSLEEVLQGNSNRFPPHVGGLIAAASRTAQLGGALEELLEHHRRMREMRWSVIAAMTYPLVVIALATGVFLFLMLDIVPIFGKMFEEFDLQLPAATISLVAISKVCVSLFLGEQSWLFVAALGTLIVGLGLIRFVSGRVAGGVFLGTAPLFGPIVTWSGTAAFARMLSVLLDYGIPLPQALELTGSAVRDGNVREACRRLAIGTADGRSMAQMLEGGSHFPATLVPFVRSGEEQGDLPGALKLASQVFIERIGLRTSLIGSISPPIIFVFVGLGIAFCVISLFMPLITLVVGLS